MGGQSWSQWLGKRWSPGVSPTPFAATWTQDWTWLSRSACGTRVLGHVVNLTLRADGQPVPKGGIDFAKEPGAGTIWQVATHGKLEGLGLATRNVRDGVTARRPSTPPQTASPH